MNLNSEQLRELEVSHMNSLILILLIQCGILLLLPFLGMIFILLVDEIKLHKKIFAILISLRLAIAYIIAQNANLFTSLMYGIDKLYVIVYYNCKLIVRGC